MRGGIVLIVVGLLLGFLAVSGKLCCLSQLVNCATSDSDSPCECGASKTAAVKMPSLNDSLAELLKPLEIPGVVYPYSV